MLALHGGSPLKTNGFPGWPQTTDTDRQALLDTIRSGNWSSGEKRAAFETRFAADCGVKHCFAVANGTVSLELILRGFGIGYGDEVILPPYTFVATLSSIIFAGATPVFADIDPTTFNISPEGVKAKITDKTRAIVAVAVGGCPPDLDALSAIAREHGVKLIVDAAQSAGHLPIDMQKMGIDVLTAPAHKGLYGIMGAGAVLFSDPAKEYPSFLPLL